MLYSFSLLMKRILSILIVVLLLIASSCYAQTKTYNFAEHERNAVALRHATENMEVNRTFKYKKHTFHVEECKLAASYDPEEGEMVQVYWRVSDSLHVFENSFVDDKGWCLPLDGGAAKGEMKKCLACIPALAPYGKELFVYAKADVSLDPDVRSCVTFWAEAEKTERTWAGEPWPGKKVWKKLQRKGKAVIGKKLGRRIK